MHRFIGVRRPKSLPRSTSSRATTTSPANLRAFCSRIRSKAARSCKRLCTGSPIRQASLKWRRRIGAIAISERSARRILNEEHQAPSISVGRDLIGTRAAIPVKGKGTRNASSKRQVRQAVNRDGRSLRLCDEDKAMLADSCKDAFLDIANRYYLDPLGAPERERSASCKRLRSPCASIS